MAVPGEGGGYDLFIPTLELSGNLQVRFSRNPKDLNVNRYVKQVPVKKKWGEFMKFHPGDQARLNTNTSAPRKTGTNWASGTPRPRGTHKQLGFTVDTFRVERYAESITLDKEAVDLANWDVQSANASALAQIMMSQRAYNVMSMLTTSGNYPSANYSATAGAITEVGASVYTGTTASPLLKKLIDYIARIIQKATFGRVKFRELAIVINPVTAVKLSQTREIREYVMQQADAYKNITLDRDDNYNSIYGLPKRLYGLELIVEDTVIDTNNRPGTQALVDADTGTYVLADDAFLVVTKTENLEATEGSNDLSTATFFVFEDMTVETKGDSWDRMLELSVVDQYAEKMTAPVTGFYVASIAS